MERLPYWVLPDNRPAVYDAESLTALEQTAKVYGAMNELITDYNAFVSAINETIETFETETNTDINDFKLLIQQQFADFTNAIEAKVIIQDGKIADAETYMHDHIVETTTALVTGAIANHEIVVALDYHSATEELDIEGGV